MLALNMGTEIERKFLPNGDAWKRIIQPPGRLIRQGYLVSGGPSTVRIRTADSQAWLTIKSLPIGASRSEFEYPIPIEDARSMLDSLCGKPFIEKTRYLVHENGHTFEIDEFHAENTGLVLVEVELESEDQPVNLPAWIGREVTGDPRYYNSRLTRTPYTAWPRES